jgi:hypothetical protein
MPAKKILLLLMPGFLFLPLNGQSDSTRKFFTIKGDWFMASQWLSPNQDNNAFKLKRGYLTVETRFNDVFSARYTQDITIDDEGDDAGNVELRFKYCYLKTALPDLSFFTNSYFEVGLVHRPWIDFEEHINDYRVQSEMFLERGKVISSADFGITYVTLLGGKLDPEYQQSVSNSYPGKYGSISLGVFNGAGYHALENNNNKTVEGRFTVRPLPEHIPGLQVSYNMAFGKGNDSLSSDFRMNSFCLSHESCWLTLTAQYYFGKGNMSGTSQSNNDGYSFFGEFVIPNTKFMVFSRYDYFHDHATDPYQIMVGGFGCRFFKQNKILFDMDWSDKSSVRRIYEIALDIRF